MTSFGREFQSERRRRIHREAREKYPKPEYENFDEEDIRESMEDEFLKALGYDEEDSDD